VSAQCHSSVLEWRHPVVASVYMDRKGTSHTAMAAATHRAAHQILEHGRIFSDPLAVAILGVDRDDIERHARQTPSSRRMRLFISIRTRFAEDSLAAAYAQGVRQLVVLGAGLDTYAYRKSLPDGLRIFEVDHPATQAFKRERLAAAHIETPNALSYVPVDFERDACGERLSAAGFDPHVRTFVTWLGVVPYLTEPAIWGTLDYVAALPGGAEVVFDYSNPPDQLSPERRVEHEARAARVAELGEEWLSYFDTEALHEQLYRIGFQRLDDLGPYEIARRYLPDVAAPVSGAGGHIIHAATA
jgi:methyltransferase (TIGR00027 family)